jgi:hypothetical protein
MAKPSNVEVALVFGITPKPKQQLTTTTRNTRAVEQRLANRQKQNLFNKWTLVLPSLVLHRSEDFSHAMR